jgi:hypothetical protein
VIEAVWSSTPGSSAKRFRSCERVLRAPSRAFRPSTFDGGSSRTNLSRFLAELDQVEQEVQHQDRPSKT